MNFFFNPSNKQIVEGIRTNDSKIMKFLDAHFKKKTGLNFYQKKFNLSKEDIEDEYQDAFNDLITLIKNQKNFKVQKSILALFKKIFLFRLIKRKDKNIRASKTFIELDDTIKQMSSSNNPLDSIINGMGIDQCLAKLKLGCQNIFHWYYEGHNFKSIGEKLGIKEDTARQRRNTCLDQLKKICPQLNLNY